MECIDMEIWEPNPENPRARNKQRDCLTTEWILLFTPNGPSPITRSRTAVFTTR